MSKWIAGTTLVVILILGAIGFGIYSDDQAQKEKEEIYKDSIKEKVVTIQSVSCRPGLEENELGQMMVKNADQLMFYTTDGEGFQNTEDNLTGKYETRDLLLNLKIGGTYKIRYVGWRDGRNSAYPNILAIVEVKNESEAVGFSWNDFIGDWNIKDLGKFDIQNYKLINGQMVYTQISENNLDTDNYRTQISNNKASVDRKVAEELDAQNS